MQYDLSVIMPGIRTSKWVDVYNSIGDSFSGSWQVVFCGPYELPEELKQKDNVVFIKDFGSPTRCRQKSLLNSTGKFINFAADDVIFCKDSLNIAYKTLIDKPHKTLVMGKYLESDNPADMMKDDIYYILNTHNAIKKCTRFFPDYYMFNTGLISRNLLVEIGGWDSCFEVCAYACNDLAIRLQNYKVKFIIQNEIMFKCSHLPGHEGDHGPIHDAQTLHDEPLFFEMYSTGHNLKRTIIDINNFSKSPDVWERRFAKKVDSNI